MVEFNDIFMLNSRLNAKILQYKVGALSPRIRSNDMIV